MKTRIGIVDDHQLFLDGLNSLLSEDTTIQVMFVANNAKTAVSYLKENPIDLLITDISMPGINGLEFVKIVKEEFPEIKILILSMFVGTIPHRQIDGYVQKESPVHELRTAIEQIIRGGYYFQGADEKIFNLEFNKNIVTTREKEIIQLIALGFSTEEMAEKLYLSKGTIETHKKNIYIKLSVNTAPEVIRKAMYLGIIK